MQTDLALISAITTTLQTLSTYPKTLHTHDASVIKKTPSTYFSIVQYCLHLDTHISSHFMTFCPNQWMWPAPSVLQELHKDRRDSWGWK